MELNYRVIEAKTQPTQNPPVVFLHGLLGYAANWGKIWPTLSAEGYSVLVFDQRGHGRSPHASVGEYDPSDYAADLRALLEKLGWGKIHLVGHSMGGRVAIRFAHKYPDKIQSLTLEDSGDHARPDRLEYFRSLFSSVPTPFSNREEAQKFFEKNFQSNMLLGMFLLSNISRQPDDTYDWRVHMDGMIETIEKGRATSAEQEFKELTCPTLLIRGSNSLEFTDEEAEAMVASRESVTLRILSPAGHFVHAEKPSEFAATVLEFISSNE